MQKNTSRYLYGYIPDKVTANWVVARFFIHNLHSPIAQSRAPGSTQTSSAAPSGSKAGSSSTTSRCSLSEVVSETGSLILLGGL